MKKVVLFAVFCISNIFGMESEIPTYDLAVILSDVQDESEYNEGLSNSDYCYETRFFEGKTEKKKEDMKLKVFTWPYFKRHEIKVLTDAFFTSNTPLENTEDLIFSIQPDVTCILSGFTQLPYTSIHNQNNVTLSLQNISFENRLDICPLNNNVISLSNVHTKGLLEIADAYVIAEYFARHVVANTSGKSSNTPISFKEGRRTVGGDYSFDNVTAPTLTIASSSKSLSRLCFKDTKAKEYTECITAVDDRVGTCGVLEDNQ